MKLIIVSVLLALSTARPDSYESPSGRTFDVIEILRDDRVHPDGGRYSFDVETENGIVRSESGSPLDIDQYPTGQQGSFSFPLPDGQIFELKFVANENGFQPESPFLPVAPEFPHPIPQFVLDQIEKAAREDTEPARSGSSNRYSYDDSDEKK